MNEAHLHLIINHFPLVGIVIGVLVLAFGLLLKKNQVVVTALGIFILCAITTALSFKTGEGAEEIVENIAGVSHELIHEHEETAERFGLPMYGIAFLSVVSLFLANKGFKFSQYLNVAILVLALFVTYLSIKVGTTGGEIRHTEIREASK